MPPSLPCRDADERELGRSRITRLSFAAPKNHKAGLVSPAFACGTGSVNLVSTAGSECQKSGSSRCSCRGVTVPRHENFLHHQREVLQFILQYWQSAPCHLHPTRCIQSGLG